MVSTFVTKTVSAATIIVSGVAIKIVSGATPRVSSMVITDRFQEEPRSVF